MSFLSRIFGVNDAPTLTRNPPNIVVADYGEFLEKRTLTPGIVADVAELPYPKGEIKTAIVVMLSKVNDSQLKEHLKSAYISLAEWQQGVGSTQKGIDFTQLSNFKSDADKDKAIAAYADEMNRWKIWQPIVEAEREALIAELKTFGYW
jgi:hypothetical protein